MSDANNNGLKQTPFFEQHVARDGKMVPFAGYAMPVQFATGIVKEHLHTRAEAGLFDVSHMGQLRIVGANPAASIERAIPGDIQALGVGEMRYSYLTNDGGGILDDLIVTRRSNDLFVVVNASRKAQDFARLTEILDDCEVMMLADRALVALQGPAAAGVMSRLAPEAVELRFMNGRALAVAGIDCFVTRSGYTGEDGFEISVPVESGADLYARLMAEPEVLPVGLGARDSLRLEAGLCLYGHDIDETTTPVEAGLGWAISKRRRAEGGFPGSAVILQQFAAKPGRRRVGIRPEGRAPAREHTEILRRDGTVIGQVTSGGFGPSVNGPVAMGYVQTDHAAAETAVDLMVRGKARPAAVARMPFVPHRYAK